MAEEPRPAIDEVARTLAEVTEQAYAQGLLEEQLCDQISSREGLSQAYSGLARVLLGCTHRAADAGEVLDFDLCQSLFLAVVRILRHLLDDPEAGGAPFHGPALQKISEPSPDWVIEETVGFLEQIHEVYDVLLTWAETYEWADPGVTGLLRLYMLQVLAMAAGYSNISGRSLMELLSNNVHSAVSVVTFVLRTRDAPFALQELAARCLVQLTTANCVFSEDPQTNEVGIASLTEQLQKHSNGMIQAIIQFDGVDAFGRCICQHQESHFRTDILVKAFLGMIHNTLLYCSMNQKQLRMHIAMRSTIVQDIMIPYVENILPALYEAPAVTPDMLEFQNLMATLQTFVVTTFNINLFRSQFLHTDLLVRVMEVPTVLDHANMLEVLIKLHINLDFVTSAFQVQQRQMLLDAVARLPEDRRRRLARRLCTPSHGLPLAKAHTKSIEALAPVFEGAELAVEEPQDAQEEAALAGNFAAFAFNEAFSDVAAQGYAEDVPTNAFCELGGGLMTDPVMTPEGHYYDRPALEEWVQVNQTNPSTGAPMTSLADCHQAMDVQASIQQYQAGVAAQGYVQAENQTLLGDLPAVGQAPQSRSSPKKEKKTIKIKRDLVQDCPDQFRCAIDGKILTNPYRSPYGHVYELKTLEQWMSSCGSVCPISNEVMTLEQCVPDKDLKKQVVKWFKGSQN